MTTAKISGRILKGIGGFYYVKTADGVLACRAKGIFRKEGITPLAGDYVLVEGSRQQEDLIIAEIKPRSNFFARPPIANVDRLFIVVSSVDPSPNILLLDKLTAISCNSGVVPTLVVTKTDIQKAEALKACYRAAGFTVVDLHGEAGALAQIDSMMAEGLSVFIGNSGVGKSTLLNALCPELGLKTAETSKKLGRGKHTTRAVELYPYRQGYIADTPGFSAVDFERGFHIEKEGLAACFLDFLPYTPNCYFSGCSHTVEKGCAVLDALQQGKILPSRHQSYRTLYEQAAQHKHWQ
jgi:ribosome biogenesis GTPase